MNHFSTPSPTPSAGRADPQGAPWPGLIPLRPLGVGDVFGAAWRLVRAHASLLCLVALSGTLLGGAAVFGVLALAPDGAVAAENAWLRRFEAGQFELPPLSLVLPLVTGAVISYLTIIVVSGLATALVGDASIGRTTTTRGRSGPDAGPVAGTARGVGGGGGAGAGRPAAASSSPGS